MSEQEAPDTRTFLQTIIDRHGLSVAAVDTYADELAGLFPAGDPRGRGVARLAMRAFIDGWHAGYEDGHGAGIKEGRDIERLGLKDAPPQA